MFFFVIKCGFCRALRRIAINYPKKKKNLVISDVCARDRGTQIRVKRNNARKDDTKREIEK